MKQAYLYFLVGFVLLTSQLSGQVVTIPLAEGANGGGGLLTYDVATQRVTTIPNLGSMGFGKISGRITRRHIV